MEIFRKDKINTKCSFNAFIKYYALEGNGKIKEKIKEYLAKLEIAEEGNDYLIINNGNKLECVFFAFKFSSLSQEDIAKCYRLAKEKKAVKAYILGRNTMRTTLSLLSEINLNIIFISAKQLYKCLNKCNLLPELNTFPKVKKRNKLKTFLAIFFSKNNAKHFLFCGVILALMSLITPIKIYYYTISGITLLFAICCLFAPAETNLGKSLFNTKNKKNEKDSEINP